jgi:hypothetical protein
VDSSAFIANIDFGWFSHFLRRVDPRDEVDLWQPSPHGFRPIPPGTPFVFRFGAPHKAIAGCGCFARYERVPVWLAWGRGASPGWRSASRPFVVQKVPSSPFRGAARASS